MGDLTKRFVVPALHASRQTADEYVAAQLSGEASEELSLAEAALGKLQETVTYLQKLGDPVFKDGLATKEKELTSLKEKIVKLQAKENKPGTKGAAASLRIRGIQSKVAGGFTTAALRNKAGEAKSKQRMESDVALIDESIAELQKRRAAVVTAESAAAHDKIRIAKEEFAIEVDGLLALKASAADNGAADALMGGKEEEAKGLDVAKSWTTLPTRTPSS
jgi:hypothetical protein